MIHNAKRENFSVNFESKDDGIFIRGGNFGKIAFGQTLLFTLTLRDTSTKDLQSNKIKYIAPFVHLIHSVDSYKLLAEIDKQGAKAGRRIPCLLQIHIAQEETKFGFTPQECLAMLAGGEWRGLANVEIRGLMCMASNTTDEAQINSEFAAVKELFNTIKENHFPADENFSVFSAGMSDDYPIAVSHGSNHVRVGSAIFAEE